MAKDFLHLVIDFFKIHWLDISLASLAIFFIISYIVINNIKITSHRPLKKGRTIVLETLQGMNGNTPTPAPSPAPTPSPSPAPSPAPTPPPDSVDKMMEKAFCKAGQKTHTLEKKCNKLSDTVCDAASCCVYAHRSDTKTSTCVAGTGSTGPTYKGDKDGNMYPYDYWYYLGKKYPR